MAHPVSSTAYPDVREAFDLALSAGRALQPFRGTPDEIRRAATRWRQRAYTFRARLRAELIARGAGPETVYDTIMCRLAPDGVVITSEPDTAALPPMALAPTTIEVPANVPDFAAIAKEFGLEDGDD